MNIPSNLYTYHLPEERIANYPAPQREHSKFLMYKNDQFSHHRFDEIPMLLPANATLFFNNTQVVPARLMFTKKTGGKIEILLLNPIDIQRPIHHTLEDIQLSHWECLIRNVKKWPSHIPLTLSKQGVILTAKRRNESTREVEFTWSPPSLTLSEVLRKVGNQPIPPYLNRHADNQDKERYQTVYSVHQGSVAAPTAGLHFSKKLITQLQEKKIIMQSLTLHVGGGTFQPIKTQNAVDHTMHAEQLLVTEEALDTLMLPDRFVIAVGTTSMRVLESIYWFGVQLLEGKKNPYVLDQTTPYQHRPAPLPSHQEALQAVKKMFHSNPSLIGRTSLFILPGYSFKLCQGLITNFHMPKSSLLLLVAAFMGEHWKILYKTALNTNYKFLSYGDSSLLLPRQP